MRQRPTGFRAISRLLIFGSVAACATSTTSTNQFGQGQTAGSASSSGGGGTNPNPGSLSGESGPSLVGSASSSSSDDGGIPRPPRCNDAGACTCFNVASLGLGGHTGAQAGTGGTDNTEAFIAFMNTESSAGAVQLGCGNDVGCTSAAKPTLSAAFLAQYDVLIFQWMANSVYPVTMKGTSYGYTGEWEGPGVGERILDILRQAETRGIAAGVMARGSEDAFDALVSVMEMVTRRDDFPQLPQSTDAVTRLEGAVWGAKV